MRKTDAILENHLHGKTAMVCRNNDDGIKSQVSVSKKICFRGIQNDNDASFHYFHRVRVYPRKYINFYCNTGYYTILCI